MVNDTTKNYFKTDINAAGILFDLGTDLKLVLLLTLATIAFIYVPALNSTIIRPVLGLAMILFIPGYALIAALFPGKADMDGIVRVVLSFGLSIAVVPLIGFGLNFTPWGVRMDPIVICLTIFTLVCTAAATIRRHSLPKDDRISVDFKGAFERVKSAVFDDKTTIDKVLTVILVLSVLLSIITVAYMIVVPRQGEKFTQFYILGPDGKADNYSTNVSLGDSQPVIVGIANHERQDVSYDLVISLNDSILDNKVYGEHMTIADNRTWEKLINVTPNRTGTNMNLEFLLYKDGNMTAPYRECNLWVNVTGNATDS